MISIAELNQAWQNIVPHPGQSIGRRADETHPLDFFITYDENNNMQLLLLSDFLPSVPSSSQQIAVRVSQRGDGNYALCFSLADKSLRNQYVSLCWDIMDCTYEAKNKRKGIQDAVKRFRMWQKLFAEIKKKRLSDTEIKGLIGELCTLKYVVLAHCSQRVSVSGWIGVLGADRDFELADTWYESKAISLNKDTVTISSLDQLDTDIEGHLIIVRIERGSENTPGSFSLNSLVDEIRELLSDDEARMIFDTRLASSNYDCRDPRAETAYVLHRIEAYTVDNEFPRVRRTEVSTAISNGTYNLSIPAIQDWRES